MPKSSRAPAVPGSALLGQDVAEVMAALDRVATTAGDEREAAIRAVQALAAAGHLAPMVAAGPAEVAP